MDVNAFVQALTVGSTERDAELRPAIVSALRSISAGDDPTTILEELGIVRGAARVDIAAINGEFWGIEVKSRRDPARYLSRQVEAYSQVVDRAVLLVDARHASSALARVPTWWDVVLVEQGRPPQLLQGGSFNVAHDRTALCQMLWRDQAQELASLYGFQSRAGRRALWEFIARVVPDVALRAAVRQAVIARPVVRAARWCV